MIRYGRMTQCAIAAASRLAEVYGGDGDRLSSSEIAASRGFPQPLVAKVLTTLTRGGILNSSPGPSGGYALARRPVDVRLADVVRLFERVEEHDLCPFGPDYCGSGPHCPLHDQIVRLKGQLSAYLDDTTLQVFCVAQEPKRRRARRTSG